MIISQCPLCHEKQLRIKKLECTACGVNFEGDFYSSPLLNLSAEQQRFIELFMLNSGSLKKMADRHKMPAYLAAGLPAEEQETRRGPQKIADVNKYIADPRPR